MQLLKLASDIDRDRFELMVVCLSEAFISLVPKFQENYVPIVLLDREKKGRLYALWKLTTIIRDFEPDIVHAFAYASRAAMPVSKIFSKSKNIVSIRTQPGRQINMFDKLINSFADMILLNSKKGAALVNFNLWRNIPLQVIYNGIDLRKFDADACGDFDFSLSPKTKVICAVARLHPVKGLDVLLNAFATLAKAMDNVQLWIVGGGQEKKNLEEQTIQLGIDSKVTFWGEQENIPAILKHAYIGVLSSHYEGLPNAVIEYMAAGLPVVATDVGGVGEVVLDGETGLLVPSGNPQILADTILFLLLNSETAILFGMTGRKRAESHFTLERMVFETEELYESLMTDGKE